MKHIVFLTLLALTAFARAEEESEHVLVLGNEDFDSAIKEHDYVLVKFYAPWCGHCKSMAPEYEKAAKQLKESGSSVKLAKVDATVHTDLASRFKVQGYPTLKFFRRGSDMEYNGPRKADGIVAWINKKLGPALNDISSMDQLNKLKEEHKVLAVFLSKDKEHDNHKAVNDLATKVDEIHFGLVTDDSLAKEIGLTGNHHFVLFKQFDEPKVEYSGNFDPSEMEKFIKVEKVPLVTEFSQESAQVVFDSDIKTHIIAFSGKKGSDYSKHLDLLKEVALPLKGKCHVVVIDMDDEEHSRVGEFFGVTSSDVPTYRVLKMEEDMAKFHPESKDFTAGSIMEFTEKVLAGNVKPHLKSAEEPEDWDKEPVKVFVAKTFPDRAIKKDKAVFVEFYAPWCGHCKALAPIWDELATHYKDNNEVVIAKVDATENELENIKIQSFPTLKFSPKGSENFIDYKGERTKEEFIKFIDANGESDKKEEKHDEL